MTTSEPDFKRLLEEYAAVNRQLGKTDHQIELLEEMRKNRSNRSDFPIVGEFITIVMFDAPKKVVEGLVDVTKLLIKRFQKRSDA